MITFEEFCTEVKSTLSYCEDIACVNLTKKTNMGVTNLLYTATSNKYKIAIGYTSYEKPCGSKSPWVAVVKGLMYEKLSMYLSQRYIKDNNLHRDTLPEALKAGQL